jgi:hypothetical protein
MARQASAERCASMNSAFSQYMLAVLRLARSYVRFRWACARAGITPAEARRRYPPPR